MTARAPRAAWVPWSVRLAAGLIVLVAALAAGIHVPAARRAVLNRVTAIVQRDYGLILAASALDYSLFDVFGPNIGLSNVSVAAVQAPDVPFLQAERLDVRLPWSALRRAFAIESLSGNGVRVRIVRRADGTTNLPTSPASEPSDPAPIPLGRLDIRRLAFELQDDLAEFGLLLPESTLTTTAADGRMVLAREGELRWRGRTTPVSELDGGIRFDGRTVGLRELRIVTGDARSVVGGTIDVLARESRLDLTVSATADLPRLARWATDEAAPAGGIAISGTITGPLASPAGSLRLQSEALTWRGLTASDLDGTVDVDSARLRVTRAEASLVGGRVQLGGELTFDRSTTALDASWTSIDAEVLARWLAPDMAARPTGRSTGTVTLRGTGTDMSGWTLRARSRIEGGSTARSQIGVSGPIDLDIADGAWRLEADVTADRTPLSARLGGRLNSAEIAASTLGGTVTSSTGNLGEIVDTLVRLETIARPESELRGMATAAVTLGGSLRAPTFQGTTDISNLGVDRIQGVDLALTGRGDLREIELEATARQGTANMLTASGTVRPTEERLDARVEGTLANLSTLGVDLPIRGSADLQLVAAGPFSNIGVNGQVRAREVQYDDYPIGPVEATVAADSRLVRADAQLAQLNARIRSEVQLESRRAQIEVAAEETDLMRLIPERTGANVSGTVSFTARAEGPIDRWEEGSAALEVSRLSARRGDLASSLASTARMSYANGLLDVADMQALVGEVRLSVVGRLPLRATSPAVPAADALRAVMVGDAAQILRTLSEAGIRDTSGLAGTGPVAVLARIGGSAERPVPEANIEYGPGVLTLPDLPPVTALEVRARIDGNRLEVVQAAGDWQGSHASGNARVPLELLAPYLPDRLASGLPKLGEPATLSARADSITPLVLAPFVARDTLAELDGRVTASAELQAASLALDDLRGEIRLDEVNLVVAGLAVTQSVPTRIVAERGVARVAAWEWTAPDSVIRVGGQVRLADRQAALLVGGRADLRLLAPMLGGTGVSTFGSVEPRIAVTGPLADPIVEGELLLEGAELRVDSPRVVATDLNALAVLTPSGLQLTRLDGRVNGGTLRGEGGLEYSSLGTAPGRLTASVQGMTLDFPTGLRSELDAEISLAVTRQTPATEARGGLTGTVTIVRSAYREPISTVASLLAAMRTRPLSQPTSTDTSMLRRLDLDMRLVTDEDVVVRNNVAQAQLGADLRIIGTAADPALSGRATLREGGTLTFGRNRYTIDQGTIDFSNPTTIEPILNVQARTRAGGEDIELTLSGPPNALDVVLSSPSAPELGEPDIASLLITGRRLEEIQGAEARIVGEEVLGYLSGDLLGAAGRVVGLDVVRLGDVNADLRRDSVAIATETDPTSRMTFVKSFRDQLEVTLSQSLREGDEQTWIVDYLPIPRLNLRFVSNDETLRSYEMRHDVTFGAPPALAREGRLARRSLPVADVVIEGMLAVPEGELRSELRLTPGRTFDPSAWQIDREGLERALEGAGHLEARVASSTAEREDGVAITYRVTSGPRTTLQVSGEPLRSSVSEAVTAAWAESISDDVLRDEVGDIVRLDLARQGYLQADVNVSIASNDTEKTLTVALTRGDRTPNRIVRVDSSDEELAAAIRDEFGADRLRALTERGTTALAQELTAALRARGYLRGEASATGPTFAGDTATWVATLTPGPLFRLGSTAIEDGGAVNDDILGGLNVPAFTEGEPFTPAALDAARTAVVAVYRRRGHAAPNVVPQTSIDEGAGLVSVRFVVEPGRQQVLSRVDIDGNRGVRSDVIAGALRLPVGEPLATDAWLEARTRVFQTGLFRRVDVSTQPLEGAPAGETVPMTARVTVQEWPALRVRYGLQLAENWQDGDPLNGRNLTPGVSADATRRTLFGRAVTLGAAATYRHRERITRVFAGTPTLWGRAVESSVTLQHGHTELPGDQPFIRDVAGVSWEQRTRVAPRVEVSYSYRFERNHTFDPNPPLDPLFPVFDITETVARLVGTAAYDTRNDPLDAARGTLLSSDFEYAPEWLGSTSGVHFVRSLTQLYYFRPWRAVVLASAARLGLARGLGGVDLIPTERFRAGGARSVRGVEEDGLGPRSAIFGDPIGGNALLLLNQEMRFPVYRWLRGVVFADLGNVFARPSDVAFGDLVGASGFGVRLVTPFGLLRLDYGRRWSSDDGPAAGRWSFGIGQAF